VPAVLSLTPPAGLGITIAQVEFWYAEQGGSLATPYCTSRREACVVSASTVNQSDPFIYAVTEAYTPTPCVTSCTIAVPVYPLHTAYYSAEFLNSYGQILATIQGIAMENTVVAGKLARRPPVRGIYSPETVTALGPLPRPPASPLPLPEIFPSRTFTSVQSGNWNDSSTWGATGAPLCHFNIPCGTDANGAGDAVVLGNLTHAVTVPAGSFSVGSSPVSDTGTAAISAVGYGANVALTISPGATLTVMGPVRMPAGTWTNNGTIVIDSSWSGAPASAAYSWTTNNVGNLSTGGSFINNGTVLGAGNSAANAACNSNTCRSGTFGLDDAGSLAYNDQGNIQCNGGTFQYVGLAANGNLSLYSNLNAVPRTIQNCTFDSLQTIEFVESTRSAAFRWTGNKVTNPLNTSSNQGSIFWDSGGSPSAPCTWSSSDIVGPLYYYGGGSSTANLNCTFANVVFEAGPGGNFGWITNSDSTGSSDQMLYYVQYPGGDATGYTLANGIQNRSVLAEYVNTNQNNGQNDMHPISLQQGNTGNTLRNWFIEGNNFGAVSSMLEPQAGPATSQTLEIENVVQTCNQAGISLGDTVNIDGGFMTNAHISIDNITSCANSGSPSMNTHAMGIGGENITFYAGNVPHIYSSVFYSDSAANGPTEALCGGSNATFAAGTIGVMGYNAYYYTAAGGGGGPYCSVGIANYVGAFTSNYEQSGWANRGPAWLAGGRRLINFDQYLGYPVSGTTWAAGVTYATGQIVSDSQSDVYSGAQFNWLFVNRSGCTALSLSANRPMTGSAWSQCWEPAAMQYIRSAALAGTTYNFAPAGASGLGVIGLLNAWTMNGYSPVGEGSVIATGGLNGTFIGAVAPQL
jgi:hypothetical protein